MVNSQTSPTVEKIFRHPIKSVGSELINSVNLIMGSTMPGDRVWALAHNKTRIPETGRHWLPCQSFLRGAIAPTLMAISAKYNEHTGVLDLHHPDAQNFRFRPNIKTDLQNFLDWIKPLCPENGPAPSLLYKVDNRGSTDTEYPSISLLSLNSLHELSEKVGADLDPRRFRGNIWLRGGKPFEEFNWVDQEIAIGNVRLKVVERIERCNATKANPLNGKKDIDTLTALQSNYGHKDFGVYCEVLKDGKISCGDQLILS